MRGLIRIGAAYEDRCQAARAAGLHYVEAWHVEKRFGQQALLFGRDFVRRDDGDASAEFGLRRRNEGRADHDWWKLDRRGGRILGIGPGGADGKGHKQKTRS